ncbi:ATP-binding protein [Clostridium malenominatum]|uniref:histidine kinase n=1 Tax=Clostridium malenominatum TaxID=1539 RepID=A0ABN1IZ76_9CLOT
MYTCFDNVPFGAMILEGDSLLIKYINGKMKEMLNYHSEYSLPKDLINKINTLRKNKKEEYLRGYKLPLEKIVDLNLSFNEGIVQVFANQVHTEECLALKEEIDRYVALSMEFKAKSDVVEILRRREKQHLMHLKDVINNISEGILVLDKEFRINLCNKSACNILNLKQIELLDYNNILKKYSICTEENNSNISNYVTHFFEDKSPVKNLVLKLKDNFTNKVKYIEFNSNPILKSNGELLYTVISIKDITDSKINKLIAENQAKFIERTLSNLSIPVIVLDYPDLKVSFANNLGIEFAKNILYIEGDSEEIIGKKIYETFDEFIKNTLVEAIHKAGKNNQEVIISPYYIEKISGKEKYYKFKITPFKYKDNYKRIYIHILDITEEINSNKELEKVNKLKDEFFTVVSHELRTPLTIIYSALQLAYDIYKEELTLNLDVTLQRINQNCSRLLKLTNNVMDISAFDAGLMKINNQQFDIVMESELIVNSVYYYARKKGINIIFDTNEEEYDVVIDKEKYIKILLNLLSNAIKYTRENKNIYVDLILRKDIFEVHVRDEGLGIAKEDIDNIFNRYLQLNNGLTRGAEGLGLGLTVVKKFVECMEGDIKVKSKKGEGSEFILEFGRYSKINTNEPQLVTINESFDDLITIEMSDIY